MPFEPASASPTEISPDDYFAHVKTIYPNAILTGGGRTAARNAQIGGATNSMHLEDQDHPQGQAIDFQVPGVPSSQVFSRLQQSGLPLTEQLNEGRVGTQGAHLHVGWRPQEQVSGGFQPVGGPVETPHQRAPAATGLGAIGQTIGDVFSSGPANHDPNAFEQGVMNLTHSAPIQGIQGSYGQAVSSGLMMQPVRFAMQSMGVGMDKLKSAYPGQSDQWYAQHLNEMYNNAVQGARQDAYTQTKNNPYFGHQIANTAAAVLGSADPTWFLNPGASLENQLVARGAIKAANPLTRIGINAAAHTAFGSASDAAAQGMDIASGLKTNFDVSQNLKSAALQGVFGAAHAGIGEATPFVKNMFAKRGMDTLPPDTPAGVNSPTTGDIMTMSPADHDQMKDLLHNGSVDDIKNFLATKQGPKPSYQDVNQLVQFRDNLPDQIKGNFQDALDQHIASVQHDTVVNHIQDVTSTWKNAPDINVVHGPEGIQDPQLRSQAVSTDVDSAGNKALGFTAPDGSVHMYSGRVPDAETANALLFHESLGHYGLQQKFGDKLDNVLTNLADRNVGQFGKDVATRQAANPGESRALSAEEVLAEESQKGPLKKSWSDAVTSTALQFGRKMGLDLSYSDGEVRQVLAMAHDAVINGKGKDVSSNGFKTPLNLEGGNKFMRTDQLGREVTNPEHLDTVDRLKTDPRYLSDHEFRGNVQELARIRETKAANGEAPLKFMRKEDLRDLPINEINDIRERGIRSLSSDLNYHKERITDFQHFIVNNKQLMGKSKAEIKAALRADDIYEGGYGPRLASVMAHYPDQVPSFLKAMQSKMNIVQGQMDRLQSARSLDDIRKELPNHIEVPPKFMRQDQLDRMKASNPEYDKQTLDELADHLSKNYTPNYVSREETQRAALEYGITPSAIKDLRTRNPGELAARVSRLGAAAEYSQAKLKETLAKLDTPDFTPMDHIKMAQQIAEFHYLTARYKSEGNELGRALAAMKTFDNFSNKHLSEILQELKDQGTGLAALADPSNPEALKFARSLKNALNSGNPKGATALMQGVNKPYWEQYLTSLHMNMMLSALSTHVKAPIDMLTGISRNVIEKAVAMPVGQLRRMIVAMTGNVPKPGVHPAELMAHTAGLIQSVGEAEVWKAMGHAVKTGEGSFVGPDGKAVRTNFSNQFGSVSNPRIPGVSLPTDLISAQDTFFRSAEMNAQLRSLGVREALSQLGSKAKTSDLLMLGDAIARNPTVTMLKEAHDLADRTLLLNNNPLNNVIDKYRQYRPGLSGWARFTRFVVGNLAPFIRVESNNLINRVVQRSPLAILDPYTRNQIKMGGVHADIAMAKIAYGTTLLGIYWAASNKKNDKLTGEGPEGTAKFKEVQAGGFIPDAVHENGRYNQADSLANSVNPFDLHNSTATMVKDIREAADNANPHNFGTAFKLGFGSMLAHLGDMSWIKDVDPALGLFAGKGARGEGAVNQFIGQEARSWTPNIVGQAARGGLGNWIPGSDPNMHDVIDPHSISQTIINEVKSATPGLVKTLPTRYSVYGEPMANGASLTGVHTIIPGLEGNGKAESTDPTIKELVRLGKASPEHAVVTPVLSVVPDYDENGDPKVDDNGKAITRKLNKFEFEKYQQLAGHYIVEDVRNEMGSPEWQSMSDEEKIQTVRDIQKDQKANAREALFQHGN